MADLIGIPAAPAAPAAPSTPPSSAGTSAPGAPPAAGGAPAAPSNWIDTLPEQFRKDPNVTKYKGLDELLNGHVNLVKRLGSNVPPPESPDKYSWTPPETLKMTPEQVLEAKKAVHAMGLDDTRAKSVLDYHYGRINEMQTAAQVAAQAEAEAETARVRQELQSEWGATFEGNLKKAQEVLAIDPVLRDLVANEGLGASKHMIKYLVEKVHPTIVRPGAGAPPSVASGSQPGDYQRQIAEIRASAEYKNAVPGSPIYQRLEALYKAAYPGTSGS